jgi:hypothetical protein
MMELGATSEETTSDDRFRAFVSYSHADAAIARKLHRKIENYRLPARLQGDGELTGHDQNHGRLGKIFRDREDLPAAQDLSEAVKQALTKSEALIVLCSPDAQASPWVAQEIELFRSLHPDRPILAALIRGEPAAAFPAPLLQGREPLAADLRKQGDGWRLGFLKIVAGIAGIPLDALVQRDATRRIRRVMAVTGSALIALLAMIGMTIFAIQSRNEAQHQQAEAEGLVEYMLTDLRTELKGVGRLDVMTKVNERAMDFYEGQGDLSEMPAESLERRARILHAMGEDDEKRGDLNKALAKFTEAHRVTETLLARDPENPDRIFGHAQSEYWVGRVAELKLDWVTAKSRYQSYFQGAAKLVAIDPHNPDYLMEMGWSHLNLGIVEIRPRTAKPFGREQFESAIQWMEKALEYRPGDFTIRKEIGNAYAWLADSYYLESDKTSYLNARRNELLAKQEWLESDPQNNAAKYAVAKAKYAIAAVQNSQENKASRDSLLLEAQSTMSQLLQIDLSNLEWNSMAKKIDDAIAEK